MTLNKAARNERLKITATWLNGAAVAALAVGCFAPITGFMMSASTAPLRVLLPILAGWFVVGTVLHMVAREILRRIEE